MKTEINYISETILENNFSQMNNIINQKKTKLDTKFLFPNAPKKARTKSNSKNKDVKKPYIKLITEQEFYKIVGLTKNGLSKKSGEYQEYLYGHYLRAKELKDDGYISDIFQKALKFQTDLNYVKSLLKNKAFAEKWRRDIGNESAVKIFKSKGNLRIVNKVKERTKKIK